MNYDGYESSGTDDNFDEREQGNVDESDDEQEVEIAPRKPPGKRAAPAAPAEGNKRAKSAAAAPAAPVAAAPAGVAVTSGKQPAAKAPASGKAKASAPAAAAAAAPSPAPAPVADPAVPLVAQRKTPKPAPAAPAAPAEIFLDEGANFTYNNTVYRVTAVARGPSPLQVSCKAHGSRVVSTFQVVADDDGRLVYEKMENAGRAAASRSRPAAGAAGSDPVSQLVQFYLQRGLHAEITLRPISSTLLSPGAAASAAPAAAAE